MRAFYLSAAALLLTACGPKVDTSPNVVLETELGVIEIETYPEKAPISAGDFLNYVDRGFYNGEGFYRVVRDEIMIRAKWGCPLFKAGVWIRKLSGNPSRMSRHL